MFNNCIIHIILNIITGENYGKETVEPEPSKEFEKDCK